MRRFLFLIALFVAIVATGQSKDSFEKQPENYSKCLCTANRYNSQKWEGTRIKEGVQDFYTDNIAIEINWVNQFIEIGDKRYNVEFPPMHLADKVQVIKVINHADLQEIRITGHESKEGYQISFK